MATEFADMAQEVEHVLGKDEVTSSNLVISSKTKPPHTRRFYFSLYLLFSFFAFLFTFSDVSEKFLKYQKTPVRGVRFHFILRLRCTNNPFKKADKLRQRSRRRDLSKYPHPCDHSFSTVAIRPP